MVAAIIVADVGMRLLFLAVDGSYCVKYMATLHSRSDVHTSGALVSESPLPC